MSYNFPVSVGNWVKLSLLFTAAPAAALAFIWQEGRLPAWEGIFFFVVLLFAAALASFPLLHDLRALRFYMEDLAEDRPVRKQPQFLLKSLDSLPDAAKALHKNWESKTKNLRTALRKNSAIFHSLPAPVLLLSADHVILDTNVSAGALFRFDLPGKRLEEVILDPKLHQVCRHLQGFEERSVQIEVHAGGKVRHFHCVLHPLTPRDAGEHHHRTPAYGSEAIICMLYDISGIIKMQEAMRDFVANASHELQTPLTGVIGFLEAMLEEDFPRDSPYYEQFLNICLQRSHALSELTRDLLSLAKIEMSSQDVFTEKADLAMLALSVADQYRYHAVLLEKKMRLLTDVDADAPPFYANGTELRLMISNLLSNALKYGGEGGAITLSVKMHEGEDAFIRDLMEKRNMDSGGSELYYASRYISLTVHNEGPPIPPDVIPRLTERFYRADPGRGADVGGTGIGLSIVSKIISHHEGMLEIISSEQEGTAFRAYFPVIEAPYVGAPAGGAGGLKLS